MSNQTTGQVNNIVAAPGITAVGASVWTNKVQGDCSVQVIVTGVGAVNATVNVEVSNGPASAPIACSTPAATVTLSSPTGRDADGFLMIDAAWKYIRLDVTVLSGSGANVTGLMGA